jgi:hypothetical protein
MTMLHHVTKIATTNGDLWGRYRCRCCSVTVAHIATTSILFACFLSHCSLGFCDVGDQADHSKGTIVGKFDHAESGREHDVGRKRRGGFFFVCLLAVTASVGCSAPIGAARGDVEFQCKVSGAAQLKSALDEGAICTLFQGSINKVLIQSVKSVKTAPAASASDWIVLDIRIDGNRSATALLANKFGGKEYRHPEIAVDAMDRELGKNDLERLAAEVARHLSDKMEDL